MSRGVEKTSRVGIAAIPSLAQSSGKSAAGESFSRLHSGIAGLDG
jgi:hypothetical protein